MQVSRPHRSLPALASWHGAQICEIAIKNINRERGESHYGISRTFRVFFDLITIRFLLKHMARPLHFFGGLGMVSMFSGAVAALALIAHKLLGNEDIMTSDGPLMIFSAVLILAGVQLLALGLLGDMQAHHYHGNGAQLPYSVDRVLRAKDESAVTD